MVLPKSMRKEWLLMEIASIWGLLRHRVCHCKFRPRSCSLVMGLENKWNLLVLPLQYHTRIEYHAFYQYVRCALFDVLSYFCVCCAIFDVLS
jgi:hypothetical protein